MDITPYASTEEFHFALWCQEALRAGYITEWAYEPLSYPLSDFAMYDKKVLRGRGKERRQVLETKHLLNDHSYTPDFIIYPTGKQFLFYFRAHIYLFMFC